MSASSKRENLLAAQEEAIETALAGHDTLALLPVGSDTRLYRHPALLDRDGIALVISSHLSLMKQETERMSPTLLARTILLIDPLESIEQELRFAEIAAGRHSLVLASPERLRQRPFIRALKRAGVRLVLIERASRVLLTSDDFSPDYQGFTSALHAIGDPQVLACTPVATPIMQERIAAALGRRLTVVHGGSLPETALLLVQGAEDDEEKRRLLLSFLVRQSGAGIVYVWDAEAAERIEGVLRQAGLSARAYHEGTGSAERSALRDRFTNGDIGVIVAVAPFGLETSKDDVRFTVHYHPPPSLEAYIHEAGCGGHDGKPSTNLLLYTVADREALMSRIQTPAIPVMTLRAAYRAVRDAVGRAGAGVVNVRELVERLSREDDRIDVTVALGLLQGAGLVYRGADVPRAGTVLLRPPGDDFGGDSDELWPLFRGLLERVTVGQPQTINLVHSAGAIGLDVAALEDRLLAWHEEGRLIYRGFGRDMWIEVPPPPPNAARRVAALLERIREERERRGTALFSYLDAHGCRRVSLSSYVGFHHGEPCGRCDRCRGD